MDMAALPAWFPAIPVYYNALSLYRVFDVPDPLDVCLDLRSRLHRAEPAGVPAMTRSPGVIVMMREMS
jgi:hypothetical protein